MTRYLLLAAVVCSITVAVSLADDPDSPQPQPPAAADEGLDRPLETFRAAQTLRATLDSLARQAGITIDVDWRSLQAVGLGRETEVTLRTDHKSARRVLELICAQVSPSGHPVRFTVDGQTVRVTADAPARRTTVAAAAQRNATAPAGRGVGLGQRADLTFEDVALADVVDAIQEISRLGVHVQWRALALSDITRETLVTVDVPGLTLARTLNLMTDGLNAGQDKYSSVYWVIDDGLITFTTGRAINRETRTRMYDVGDLLMAIPDFAAPRFDIGEVLASGGAASTDFWADSEDEDDEPTREETEQLLIDTIKDLLDGDMWVDGGGQGSVRIVGNRLIVTQTRLGWLLMARTR